MCASNTSIHNFERTFWIQTSLHTIKAKALKFILVEDLDITLYLWNSKKLKSDQGIYNTLPWTTYHHVERKNRYVMETSLAMLMRSIVPMSYWDYAFKTSIRLINQFSSRSLNLSSSYELLFKTKPDYSYIKIFGWICFLLLRPYNINKLEPRLLPYILLEYVAQHKGYWYLEPILGKIYVSTHVMFNETNFSSFVHTYLNT